MLKDTITYGKQTILIIYHDNDELDVSNRNWLEREKVGRYWLEFKECSVTSKDALPAEDKNTEHLILPYADPLSPCNDHKTCAITTRFRTAEKPNKIFTNGGTNLRLDLETISKIFSFVKNYTGIDLMKVPMACGDIFLFHYVSLDYHETRKGSINVLSTGFDRVEIHFKISGLICSCQIERLNPELKTELDFLPKCDWDSFDIFAYLEDCLLFYASNVYFMRSMTFRMTQGAPVGIKMRERGYDLKFNRPAVELSRIGASKSSLRLKQDQIQAKILEKLEQESKKAGSYLVTSGKDKKVYETVAALLNRGWEEAILIDPYLLAKYSKSILTDWICLLCFSPSSRVYAIYTASDKCLTIDEAKRLIKGRWDLNQKLLSCPGRLKLVGISKVIHDRFLICRSGNTYAGISFGTSINSLHDNYYCVHTLTPQLAEECWRVFLNVIEERKKEELVL